MFTPKDIAEYYNTTQNHYEKWWKLKKNLSLHYGIWEKDTKNFSQALANTNRIMMDLANISASDKVLDAGCGVGGAALFLAAQKQVKVVGITLSQKQHDFANRMAKEKQLNDRVNFHLMDYTQTTFVDHSFDVIWACESVSSAPKKELFINEAFRLLKPKGHLILSDYFLTEDTPNNNALIKKWEQSWSISNLVTMDTFTEQFKKTGFSNITTYDYTNKIIKSARRMFYASLLGTIPSEIYNLFHPRVSRFAKKHYKSGFYQYKTLKANLWKYQIILAVK